MRLGALEAGGTKMVCAIGNEQGEIFEQISIPTETPEIILKYNSVASVTVYSFAIPVFGTILSAIILKEGAQAASLQSLAALVLITVGIIMVNREENKR